MQTDKHKQFEQWLQTSSGISLLQAEQACIEPLWEKILGDYLLMLGHPAQIPLTQNCKIKKKIHLSPNEKIIGQNNLICAAYETLPIMPHRIDTILLPHTLDFASNPYQILREVETAITPEGHLLIIGFNPFSARGLRRLFSRRKNSSWSGTFYSASRIKDWLKVLNFDVISIKRAVYRPPFLQKQIFQHLKFLDIVCKMLFPIFGGVYIILAKKKTFTLTPIRKHWKKLPNILSKGIIKPATRNAHNYE